MKRPLIISNLRAFQQFIEKRARAKTTGPIYGRLIGRKLTVSTEPTCPGWYPDSPPVELTLLELPAPSKAREWWRELIYGEIVDFRLCDEGVFTIAVIAKAAVWDSIPELRIPNFKTQFRVVSEQRFARLVGQENFSAMIGECAETGISVRRVWTTVRLKPKRRVDQHHVSLNGQKPDPDSRV